jgi:hypothetical protein
VGGLRRAADWLGAVAGALLAHNTEAGAVGTAPIRLVDGSVIRSPGQAAPDWRLHLAYDPMAACITAIDLTDTRGAERLERAGVTPGEIRLADRGYGNRPEGVQAITAQGGDYVVRVGWRRLRWLAPAGGLAFLARIGTASLGEAAVHVGRPPAICCC